MVFTSFHIFVDTSVLVNVVYAAALYHSLNRPRPKILDLLENNELVIYTDNAVIREFREVALRNLLNSVDRVRHGWGNVEINVMEQYCISELNDMVSRRYVRIVEDDEALEVQRRALRYRPKRRICWRDEVMNRLLGKIPGEDIDIVNSLLYAYDLLATVPRRSSPGITTGKLAFITNDKPLRNFIEGYLTCNNCPCPSKIITLSYVEFKEQLKQV